MRFDSIHARKSIRIESTDSIRLHMAVTQEVGRKGTAWLGSGTRINIYCGSAVIRRSVVWQTDANNQYNRTGRSDFFGKPISESNRFESRIGMFCC